jgi:hypothetical protein
MYFYLFNYKNTSNKIQYMSLTYIEELNKIYKLKNKK